MPRFLSYVILAGSWFTSLSLSSQVILDSKPYNHIHAQHSSEVVYKPDPVLEEWIEYERIFSLNQILANIGPDGANATGTAPGCILASPSKHAPDYFYQWIRDGAITIKTLIDHWEIGSWATVDKDVILDSWLEMFLNYVDMQGKLQQVENPSGGFYNGGLGEPKFQANGTAFMREWGRPQRDGPALRASALVAFLRKASKTRPDVLQDRELLKRLYDVRLPPRSIIKADLEYVSHSWFEHGFDAWEEVNGLHFFTAMVQLKAMTDGVEIATQFNDPGAAEWYRMHQQSLSNFVWKFWDERKGHLVSTLNIQHRNGLNCDLLLGSLHGDGISFPPWSDELLVSMERLIAQMVELHPLNSEPSSKYGKPKGVGIGRYKEDIYDGTGFDGGNAWFICTSSAAQVLYASIAHFIEQHSITLTNRNIGFFRGINPELRSTGELFADSDVLFNATMQWMFEYGDSFLKVVKQHVTPQGRMAEQFDTKTGRQHGAEDLTWSYGSFLSAVQQRDRTRRLLYGV